MSRAFDHRWRLLLFSCALVAVSSDATQLKSAATNSTSIVELQGHVTPGPSPHYPMLFKPVSGLSARSHAEAGTSYMIVSNQMSTALFVDTNLQSKLLLLKGRIDARTQRFEVTGNYRSIRNGKTCDLYYYCDICAIKSSDPGPCMCCREPVHLVEEPK